jgi:hypothetical protein
MGGDPLDSLGAKKNLDRFGAPLAMEGGAEFSRRVFGSNGNNLRMVARDLFGDQRDMGARRKRDDLKSPRKRIDNTQTLAPDGAGGT